MEGESEEAIACRKSKGKSETSVAKSLLGMV